MRLIIETIIRHGILNVEIMILQTGLPDQLIADQQGKTLARNTVAVQKTAFHPALIDAQLRCQFLDRKHAFAADDDFSGSVNHWRNGVFMLLIEQKRFPLRPQLLQIGSLIKRFDQGFRPARKIKFQLILSITHRF